MSTLRHPQGVVKYTLNKDEHNMTVAFFATVVKPRKTHTNMDKHRACNCALALLGERQYTENTETQRACDLWYDHILRTAIGRHDWSFCRKYATLADAGQGNYPLPPNCLKVLAISRRDIRPCISGHFLLAPEAAGEPIGIRYTSDITAQGGELPDSAPLFCEGFIHLLASRLASTLNPSLTDALESRARQYFMDALTQDKQQDASNDGSPAVAWELDIDTRISGHRHNELLW